MKSLIEILPIVISVFAVAIPFVAAVYTKRAATASITTAHRMDWIKTVRQCCVDFLIEFGKKDPDVGEMKALAIKIQLYGYGSTYKKLFGCLEDCIAFAEDPNPAKDISQKEILSQSLVAEAQFVLNGVWWRVKREAGITQAADNRIGRQYRKKYLHNGQDMNEPEEKIHSV